MVIPDNPTIPAQINSFQLISQTRQLMPNGRPDFLILKEMPTIKKLAQKEREDKIVTAIYLLIKTFCDSFGVKRPMSEVQMVKAASWIYEESGSFRLEDIQIMFTMAERGFFQINGGNGVMDRIDIGVIEQIFSQYFTYRADQLREIQEKEFDSYEQTVKRNYKLPIMSFPPYKHRQYNIRPGTWVRIDGVFIPEKGKRYVNFDAQSLIDSLKKDLIFKEEEKRLLREKTKQEKKAERDKLIKNFVESYNKQNNGE